MKFPHARFHDSLYGLQANFAFLLGACFADPDYVAAHGGERVLIQDDFDYLTAPQSETSAHPEPIVRRIKHKARLSFQIEDQAGTPFAQASFRVATFENGHPSPPARIRTDRSTQNYEPKGIRKS